MKSRLNALLALFSVAFLAACTSAPAADDELPHEPVIEEDPVELTGWPEDLVVDPDWLQANLEAPDLVVIHIGANEEAWGEAHIPGQIYIDFETIVDGSFEEGFLLPELGELRQIFEAAGVGDDTGVILTGDLEGLMATRGFLTLEALGRTEGVALLNGGLAQWRTEQRPLSDSPASPTAATLTTPDNPHIIIDADAVLELLDDPAFQLVDARPTNEFTGEVAGDGVRRAGHIPGAINIFWKESLRSDNRPLLSSTDTISALYAERGVDEARTVVAYCRTGMQGSFGYFLGRLLDREVVLYDGSFVDWTQDYDRPVSP